MDGIRPLLTRSGRHLSGIGSLVSRGVVATARVLRWGFSAVEDEPEPRDLRLPGPAHGPVPAIELRIAERRRSAS